MTGNMSIEEFINSPDTIDFVTVPSEYVEVYLRNNPNVFLSGILGGRFIIGYINKNYYDELIKIIGPSFFSSTPFVVGLLDRRNLESAGVIQVQQQPFLDLRGSGVLIGFVDTGIDYTLDVFKYEDGTSKIQYIYDQTVPGVPPEGYFIGSEYNNEQINQALRSENPFDIVPHRDTVGHGTFLASVAAGREVGDYIGAAPDSELIVVKLKEARQFYRERYLIPEDQRNVYEYTAVIVGIEYILNKARELNRPIIICLGVGTNQGYHDGFGLFQEYLNEISSYIGVCVCAAAGNESQAKHHTEGKIAQQGQSADIDITTGDRPNDVYLMLWNTVSDRMSVSIKSPTGELIRRIAPVSGVVNQYRLILENTDITVEYNFPLEGRGSQLTIIRLINATPGVWTITVHGDVILDGTYFAYLHITGLVPPNVEFISADPNGTIVVPATAQGPICCGAYDSMSNSLYFNSSWGPTKYPKIAPDFVAPGVNVGGFYPGGYGSMTGTSVANAIAAGASALLMQWGIVNRNEVGMSTYQIKAYLIRGCNQISSISYPNNQWGYGSINLINTFIQMREM